MKRHHTILLLAMACVPTWAAEESTEEIQATNAVPVLRESDLKVEARIIKQTYVKEAPEIPGTPAPEGYIHVSARLVQDPGLPDPPPPEPPVPNQELSEEFKALLEKSRRTLRFAFVSATVYDHEKTYFRIHPNNGKSKEIVGWSNIDFNHFCGAAGFETTTLDGETIHYDLLMGIGNEASEKSKAFLARWPDYEPRESPKLPVITSSGPAFVLTDDSKDPESLEIVETLHNYYRAEGDNLKALYLERQKAYEARKAYLIAHPPKPKDVDVIFWKREKPLATHAPVETPETLTEEDAR